MTEYGLVDRLKGMVVFSGSLIIYSFSTMLIKVGMKNNNLTAQEILYYVSLVVVVLFYISQKKNG